MKTAIVYVGAAVAEIAGCFAFWGWLRLGKPIWWLLPGVCSLIAFAYLLTLVETGSPPSWQPRGVAGLAEPFHHLVEMRAVAGFDHDFEQCALGG